MAEVTEEQIAEWKEKYGEVYKLKVEDAVCYLKEPDRKTLSYATTVGQKDPMKFNEIMLNSCWLGGDEIIKTKDSYFLSASTKLAELIQIKEATLEKL